VIPGWTLVLIAASGIIVAAFRTWRGQLRMTEAAGLKLQMATEKHALEKQELERTHAEEKDRLEKTIALLRSPSPLALEIDGIALDLNTPSKITKNTCQIRIHNKAHDKTALNVQAELVDFQDSAANKDAFRPPKLLLFHPQSENDKSINPDTSGIFDLFDASKPIAIEGQPSGRVSAHFIKADKWLLFEKNTNYRFTIKASASNFPSTTTEFNLNFSGDKYDCRFTLTRV